MAVARIGGSFLPLAADAIGAATTPEYVGVVNIHFQASHPGHMLFQGPGYHHWISNDFGRTYEPIDTPGHTMGYGAEIKIHPSKPDWVLSRVQRNECLKVIMLGSVNGPPPIQYLLRGVGWQNYGQRKGCARALVAAGLSAA